MNVTKYHMCYDEVDTRECLRSDVNSHVLRSRHNFALPFSSSTSPRVKQVDHKPTVNTNHRDTLRLFLVTSNWPGTDNFISPVFLPIKNFLAN